MRYTLSVLLKMGIILVEEIPNQSSLEIPFSVHPNNNLRDLQIAVRLECDPHRLHDYFAKKAYDNAETLLHQSLQEVLSSYDPHMRVCTSSLGLGHDFLSLLLYDKGTNPERKLRSMLFRFLAKIEENIKKLNEQKPEPPPPSNPNPYAAPTPE